MTGAGRTGLLSLRTYNQSLTVVRSPSEKSLVEILQERPDTRFDGWRIDESKVERYKERDYRAAYQDGHGNHYKTDNDYIQTREKDGQRVAILVALVGDENIGISHPHPELPHLIGLYVREPYRSEGLASELVHGFIETVDHDRRVVDCADRVKPFYEQLDCEVIYLKQFKSVSPLD